MFAKLMGVKRQRIAALLMFAMITTAQNSLLADGPIPDRTPIVIAHRGFSGIAPENTLPAFRLALDAEADLVELDYYHSSDGIPVVIHDATLKRTTDIATRWNRPDAPVDEFTAKQLADLDAGTWFDTKFAGTRIPTLEEAIRLIQTGSTTLIEHKGGDAKTLIELLEKMECTDAVVVQSFDWEFLAACRELNPTLKLGALGPPKTWNGKTLTNDEKVLTKEFVDHLATLGAQVIGWNRGVTPEAIEHAHDKNLKVWVYTINKPVEALALVSMGVDGIITDQPSDIRKALEAD